MSTSQTKAEATYDYSKARKLGQQAYQRYLSNGAYPYLPVLEELLPHSEIVAEVNLGLVQIPADKIVGTYTAGRRTAFAPNFMPLLEEGTEFAGKWVSLCASHLSEGIRDPIKVYEFMNRFYVMEGNKRVSVLKFFGAAAVPGTVTRIIPRRSDEKENKIYYEFLQFYKKTEVNYIWFSEEGRFTKLLDIVTNGTEQELNEDERQDLHSAYTRFSSAYKANGGDKLPITTGDALLAYLAIYDYESLKSKFPMELKDELEKMWDEFLMLTENESPELLMNPTEEPKRGLFSIFLPSASSKRLNIAFLHAKSPETSSWTYGHELGRMYLDEVFGEQVETYSINNVKPDDTGYETIISAIEADNDIIFTTTPQLMGPSVKAAIEHPDVKILNCSLNISHRFIRTYYGRLYEAKYLNGMIAGAMADNDKIGYIADYPIYGMTANINAFALGARSVNPRAKVYLEWSTVKDQDINKRFHDQNIRYVSSQDLITPNSASRKFGLYYLGDDAPENISTPIWNWGIMYKKLVQSILSGSWKSEESPEGNRALNYWWGMSADVIDIIYSQKLPTGLIRLVEFIKKNICSGDFHPFCGKITSQNGIILSESGNDHLSPEEIITMDWLADNIVGSIPTPEELTDEALAVVRLQGIYGQE